MRLKSEKGAQRALINAARQSDRRTVRKHTGGTGTKRLNLLIGILAGNFKKVLKYYGSSYLI